MSLICLISAKGAPGTTTTAMLLAALWPRESVLVDADPMGGDIGLRLPSESGGPLQTDAGLLRLLPAARRGLTPDVVLAHCQEAQGGQPVLTGLEGPEQASAGGGLWDELGQAFATLPERDVIVDAGQAHLSASTLPLLRRATAVVIVGQPTLTSVVHTRQRIGALRSELTGPDGHTPLLGFVLVESAKTRTDDTEAAAARLSESVDSLRFLGAISHDRSSVRMFDGFPQRHPERSLLVRSGSAVVRALSGVLPGQEPPEAEVAEYAAPMKPPQQTPESPMQQAAAPAHTAESRAARLPTATPNPWLVDEAVDPGAADQTRPAEPTATTRREARGKRWQGKRGKR